MPTINVSAGTVFYTEQGQGEPLVLLHANPGDSQDFAAVVPTLAQYFRVLTLDWPGYGQSSLKAPIASVDMLLYYNILREFMAMLSLPPAFFIGNSIGGNACARLASGTPRLVRGLVLVAPGGFTAHNLLSRLFCRWQGSRFSLSPFRFARLYLKHSTPTVMGMLKRAQTVQATPQRKALNRAMWRSFARPENDLRQLAGKINAPTLLLFGKDDPVISATRDGQAVANSIPGARLIILPCGHAAFAEVPELFLAEVLPFLKSINH